MDYAATLDAALPKIGAEKIADRRQEQQQWEKLCFQLGTPGEEAERAKACQAMAERIGSKAAAAARVFLTTQLERIGGKECVAALAENLRDGDGHVRDAARRALAKNPAPEAGEALRAALKANAKHPSPAELVSALGYRGEDASVGAIAPHLSNSDQALAVAAAKALANIATPGAATALAAARAKANGEARLWIGDAQLTCADAMAKRGDKKSATAIYKELTAEAEPGPVRTAAAHALASR